MVRLAVFAFSRLDLGEGLFFFDTHDARAQVPETESWWQYVAIVKSCSAIVVCGCLRLVESSASGFGQTELKQVMDLRPNAAYCSLFALTGCSKSVCFPCMARASSVMFGKAER